MIVLLGPLGILGSLVLNRGRSQELSEVISVEAAYFQLAVFYKQFLGKSRRSQYVMKQLRDLQTQSQSEMMANLLTVRSLLVT